MISADDFITPCLETKFTPYLETWKKFLKQQAFLGGFPKADEDILDMEVESLHKELQITYEYEEKADKESRAIHEVLDIIDERIDYNELLIKEAQTLSTLPTDQAHTFLKENFSSKISKLPTKAFDMIISSPFSMIDSINEDIKFYNALRQLLSQNLNNTNLLPILCINIKAKLSREKQGMPEVDKKNPKLEVYQLEKILGIIQPHLPQSFPDFEKLHTNKVKPLSNYDNQCINLNYVKSIKDSCVGFQDELQNNSILDKDTIDYFIFLNTDLISGLEYLINIVEPRTQFSEYKANGVKMKDVPKPTTVKEKKQQTELVYSQNLITMNNEERVEATTTEMTFVYEVFQQAFEINEDLLKMQKNYQKYQAKALEEKAKTQAKATVTVTTETTKEKDVLPQTPSIIQPQEGLPLPPTPLPATTVTPEPKNDSKEENKEAQEYKQKQALKLAAFRKEQALQKEVNKQEKADFLRERASLLRDIVEEDSKEDGELQAFEAEQLRYLADRMNQDHFRALIGLSTKETTRFDRMKTLLTTIRGTTNTSTGSTHFEILVPNTRKPWTKNENGEYQNIPTVRRAPWLHNNEGGHSNSDLQPRAKARYLAAFKEAGITMPRIQAARAFQTRINLPRI